jgi:hypothetical protein
MTEDITSVNAVPCAWVDGQINTSGCASCNYSNQTGCLTSSYLQRRAISTPVSVTVTDVRIPGDSVKATIVVTILSNLPSGAYYLRVMAMKEL